MSAPTVIGLDLSITATGIVDFEGYANTVGGKSSLGDRRLCVIVSEVEELFTVHGDLHDSTCKVDLAVIEDLPTHAHGAGVTGMVHGAVRYMLLAWGVPYATVVPSVLKKYATGKGNANKTEMALALYKRFGLELGDDNQVDAWWLRAMGMDALGAPLVDLPAAQRDAMAKVAWPT